MRTPSANVIRVRPAGSVTLGYSEERISSIVNALTGSDPRASITLSVGLDLSPMTPVWIEEHAESVREFLSTDDVLLIDIDFDRTVPRAFAVCDILVAELLRAVADAVREETRIVILVDTVPTPADALYDVPAEAPFEGRLVLVCGEEFAGRIPDLEYEAIAAVTRSDATDWRTAFEAATLRHRGIFTAEAHSDHPHYLFYYDAMPAAQDALVLGMRDYFSRHETALVLFDSATAGHWFKASLVAGGLPLGVAYLDARYLAGAPEGASQSEIDSVRNALELLEDPETNLCLAVPAYKSGRTLMRLLEAARRPAGPEVRFLSVLLDAAQIEGTPANLQASNGMMSRVVQRYGGKDFHLDFALSVPLRVLPTEDWKIEAARVLGELERTGPESAQPTGRADSQSRPGRVALWSLIEEYGAGVETPVPRGRPPVEHFPQLGNLEAWDAHWLAEMAVRQVLSATGRAREALLIILPDEGSAARPLANALKERCQTAVMRMPRSVIEDPTLLSERDSARLRRHSADAVCVMDESAVTHSTFWAIGNIVEHEIGRRPDLSLAIMDLGSRGTRRTSPFLAFMAWDPLRFVRGDK